MGAPLCQFEVATKRSLIICASPTDDEERNVLNDNEILKIALDIRHPNLVFADADWICCVTSVKIQQMDGETSRVTMSPLVKK